MSVIGDDIKENSDTILLMEPKRNERTYKFFSNLSACLNAIVDIYEETRKKDEEGDIKHFYKWIDDFYQIKLFSFDKEISRYKLKTAADLKNLFEPNEGNNGNYRPKENGHTNGTDSSINSCSLNIGDDHRALDMEESDDDDDENWDD